MAVKTILLPLDGSALSSRAVPHAAALARANNARLVLVTAARARPFFADDLALAELVAIEQAESELAAVARRLENQGIDVTVRVPYGAAADGILDEALFEGADLIVMSTHGRGGVDRLVHGSVTDQIIHRANVPVLVVPPGAPGCFQVGQRRVVVPLDGSGLASNALEPAIELAKALRATLVLLRVIEPYFYGYTYGDVYGSTPMLEIDPEQETADAKLYLEDLASQVRLTGQPVEVVVEIGKASAVIAEVAHRVGATAIAMATHGRGGLARFMIGSVATGVLLHAESPVLLVRPPSAPVTRQVERPLEAAR